MSSPACSYVHGWTSCMYVHICHCIFPPFLRLFFYARYSLSLYSHEQLVILDYSCESPKVSVNITKALGSQLLYGILSWYLFTDSFLRWQLNHNEPSKPVQLLYDTVKNNVILNIAQVRWVQRKACEVTVYRYLLETKKCLCEPITVTALWTHHCHCEPSEVTVNPLESLLSANSSQPF
jgi:hypothetical protein